jgi:lariat debranching enzyme
LLYFICLRNSICANLPTQIIDIPEPEGAAEGGPPVLSYDEEWLAVVRATQSLLSLGHAPSPMPPPELLLPAVERERLVVRAYAASRPEGLRIPEDFAPTAPAHAPAEDPRGHLAAAGGGGGRGRGGRGGRGGGGGAWREGRGAREPPPALYSNPQTERFCAMLGIPNHVNPQAQSAFGLGGPGEAEDVGPGEAEDVGPGEAVEE